jgi:Arc/MetJ-type ribon-helix-helix transcriptional regulator
VETCVIAVRVPLALRDQLDRYLDRLETRVGLKASRTEIIRHALRLFLEARDATPATPPAVLEHVPERGTLVAYQGRQATVIDFFPDYLPKVQIRYTDDGTTTTVPDFHLLQPVE